MNSLANITRFRQLKKLIRKDQDNLIIGIDVGKNTSIACFYSLNKEIIVPKYRVPHTCDGFNDLLKKIEQVKLKHSLKDVIIGVEPTANYHKALCEFLQNNGHYIVYVSSVAAKNNRRTMFAGRWGKNDPKDAFNVVDLMLQGKIMFYKNQNGNDADLLNYIKIRQRLVKEKASLKIRIRNSIWACYFPELCKIYTNSDDPDVLTMLKHCPTAVHIKNLDFQCFIGLFNKTSSSDNKRLTKLTKVWEVAKKSIGFKAPQSVSYETKLIAESIIKIQNQINEIEKILHKKCIADPIFNKLFSIPGFGILVVSTFKAVIGNINMFNHPKQIIKLIGIDIETMESGKFQGTAKISKKGNALLRYMVCMAANIAISKNKDIKTLFETKLKNKGLNKTTRAKLKIKIAEKLIRIAFHILKNNVTFDINNLTVPVEESVYNYVRAH